MPFLDEFSPIDRETGQAAPKQQSVLGDFWEQPQPVGFLEGFRAGVNLENPVLSALNSAEYLRIGNEAEPGFNPVQFAKDNGVEDMTQQLMWANNQRYANAIISHTQKEREFRRIREASGFGGFVGDLIGSLASPTNFIPGVGLVRAIQGGYAVGRSAVAIGGMAAGSAALDEAVLQATQQERSGVETAVAVGGSALLGALLGGVAASTLTKAEARLFERGWNNLNEASVGSEATKKWSYDDLSVTGWLARGVVAASDFMNPNIRLATSPSLVSRELGQMLGENTLYYKLHSEGFSAAPGGAVETEAFKLLRSSLNLGLSELETQYKAMKSSGMSMTWDEFDRAVGMAMRRGDVGENDYVSAAAKGLRNNTFEPLKKEAIDAGLLPPDVSIDEAVSYFSRVYQIEKIVANEADFKARVLPWMEQKMATAFEEHRAKTLTKVEQLRANMADMALDREGRARVLSDIDMQMSELATTYREGFDADQEIKRLNREATKAKKEGDQAKAESLRTQAKSMADAAAKYREAVNPILRRRRVVERGTGAADAKIEKIQNQLVDLEEANLTSLRRLVNKGRWLERELGKAGTEQELIEKIAQLNETFNQVAKQFDAALDRIAETTRKIDEEAAKLKEAGATAEGKSGVERAQAFNEYQKKLAPMQERLAKFENAQQARRAKLDSLAERLDAAEGVDLVEVRATLNQMVEELLVDISSMTLGRGERAARLLARMEQLDPAKVAEQIAKMEAKAKLFEDNFRNRWEVKMLGEGVELDGAGRAKFKTAAADAVQEIVDAITGKTNMMNTGEMSEWRISPKRGPLRDRTFHIPDEMIEDYLNSSSKQVSEVMARRMAGQIAIAKKFPGDPTLEGKIGEIKSDYQKLKDRVISSESYEQALREIGETYGFKEKLKETFKGFEKSQQGLLRWLDDQLHSDVNDVQGLRDLILGRYKPEAHASNWGRTLRAANQFNYIRMSGAFLIASLSDMYRAPMMQGLGRSLGSLPGMLSKNLTSEGVKVSTAAVREAKLAGLVSERVLHSKMASIAELGDPFAHGNQAERVLENMSRFSTKWNGMALYQDWLESWTSITAQNNIVDAVKTGGSGRFDRTWLSMLGIDEQSGMARLVSTELEKHAEQVDGIWVANTEKWENRRAVDAYRNALSKEVTRTIIRPSQGDVPLWWKTPAGQAMFQFRSFNMAAHQRILLAGLQEGPARFLSGLIGMTTIGMAVSFLKAYGNGQESYERWKKQAENPMFLLGEGLDNSGLFTMFFEVANSVEKATKGTQAHFNPIKSPLVMLGGGDANVDSQKSWNIPLEQSLLGPTVGLLSATKTAANVGLQAATGEEVSKGEARAAARIIPYSTHFGLKQVIQLLNDDLPYMR